MRNKRFVTISMKYNIYKTDKFFQVINEDNISIEVIESDPKDYIFKKEIEVILKEDIESIVDAKFFKTKLQKRNFGFKSVLISKNNRNDDTSYSDKPYEMVAENKTHFQIYVRCVGLEYITTLHKSEHDVVVLKKDMF